MDFREEDSSGGVDGCILTEDELNAGLGGLVKDVHVQHAKWLQILPQLSRADFWVVGGNAVCGPELRLTTLKD